MLLVPLQSLSTTWLIDRDDLIHIESGNEYQGFEVQEALKSGIVLANNGSITIDLDKDDKTYFTDSLVFPDLRRGEKEVHLRKDT